MITKRIRAASRRLLCKLLKILNQFTIGGPHGLSTHQTSVAAKMAFTDTLTNMIKHRCHIRQHHHHCQDQDCRHHHPQLPLLYHQYHGFIMSTSFTRTQMNIPTIGYYLLGCIQPPDAKIQAMGLQPFSPAIGVIHFSHPGNPGKMLQRLWFFDAFRIVF